jgi:hypothetical protein
MCLVTFNCNMLQSHMPKEEKLPVIIMMPN